MKKEIVLLIFLMTSVFSFTQRNNDYSLAQSYFRNEEYEKAEKLFEKLFTRNSNNTSYLSNLISCYHELDKYALADETLNKQLKKKPAASFINVFLGYNQEKQQNIEQATVYYEKAISALEKNTNYATKTANIFKQFNKLDYEARVYKLLMKQNPKANYGMQLARIYGEKGDFLEMFESYMNYLDKNERYLNTVKRYTSKYITDDREDDNNILFKKVLLKKSASNPKNVWNDLLSWLFIKQKDYFKAFIQQKALFNRDEKYLSKIIQLGDIAFKNKEYETAAQCFDFIIANTNFQEDKFDAMRMKLLVAIETNEEGIEEKFQEVFDVYGINRNTLSIQLAYANYLTFHKDDSEKAYKVLEQALEFAPNEYSKARVKIQMGDVLVYQNKFNKALIYFSQVQTKLKNHELAQEARYKVAQTSYFKNDFKWAKAQLKVLKSSTTQLISNDATELFLTISDNEPKDSIATGLSKYAKASLLHKQNKNAEAITMLDEILKDFPNQAIEDEALFQQAKVYTELKEYEKAIANYNKIIEIDAQGIFADDVYYNLAEIYNYKLNNSEKASENYQKIIFDFPASIYLVDARKKYRKLRGDAI